MKKVFAISSKFMVAAAAMVMSAAVLTSCDKSADDKTDNTKTTYTLSGNASGSQMVPAVSGNGTATMAGTYNATTGVMNYTVTWTGLSSAPTMGAFYTGASGSTGTAVGSNWTLGSNLGTSGTYTGSMTLTADQATQLKAGNWYYVLGTSTNSTGEVRGQVTATIQ